VVNEFNFKPPFLKLGQNIGLLVGAAFWGVGSDIWGRKYFLAIHSSLFTVIDLELSRLSFNVTLLITGVFAVAAGGSPGFVALCSFAAVWSIGVGGNLPVDSSVFLEFVPASHQYLLTVLSIWWALGQLIGSLVYFFIYCLIVANSQATQIAWPLISNFSCPTTVPPSPCPQSSNQGWRYFLFTMGGLMLFLWAIRFFVFSLYESPKYLMGRGRDEQAVAIVHKVATYNGRTSHLSVEDLQRVGIYGTHDGLVQMHQATNVIAVVKRKLRQFSGAHVRALFASKKLAWSTSILIVLWGQ
jgi:MFS family permease